jgi:hypothetical protein
VRALVTVLEAFGWLCIAAFAITAIDVLHEVVADVLSIGRARRIARHARRNRTTDHHRSSEEE